MADIRSRPSTDTYRENWDRIFGTPTVTHNVRLDGAFVANKRLLADLANLAPEQLLAYDSHPAAD